jgi:translation initiation factor 3 subunit E
MADAATNGGNVAEQYSLLPKLMPNLDRHLIYPLLNFSADEDAEQPLEQKKMLLELLKPTNMTDFVGQLYQDVHNLDDMPAEYTKKREEVIKRRDQLEEETSKISGLLDDENVVTNLRSDKVQNLQYLKDSHGVTVEMVNQLYEFGSFQYSCGVYPHAAELLYRFRVLVSYIQNVVCIVQYWLRQTTDNDKEREATWGKLACEILSVNWDSAIEEINKLKETIDTRLFNNPLAQLQHRTWLIHWSLFPLFNHEPAREALTDMFFSPSYINTIQTNCPWILRYLAAAVITNRSKGRNSNQYQKQLKDLIRIVRQEGYEYSDPVTDFIKALYIDFDFEEAQKKLGETEEILKNDFFLLGAADQFVDAARHLISESYCKIHQRIDIKWVW